MLNGKRPLTSMWSLEKLYVALRMTALHDLEVKAAIVLNVFVIKPNREKIWSVLGPEFGDGAGKSPIIVRVLYKLKSMGVSFRAHLAECMNALGCEFCKTDPDLWWKPDMRPQDKFEYDSNILCYVDNILCVHHNPDDVLNR